MVRDARGNHDRYRGSGTASGHYRRRGYRGRPHHKARPLGLLHDCCGGRTGFHGMDEDQGIEGGALQLLVSSPGKEAGRCGGGRTLVAQTRQLVYSPPGQGVFVGVGGGAEVGVSAPVCVRAGLRALRSLSGLELGLMSGLGIGFVAGVGIGTGAGTGVGAEIRAAVGVEVALRFLVGVKAGIGLGVGGGSRLRWGWSWGRATEGTT